MDKIIQILHAILNILGKLSLDIEQMPDGKLKVCFIIDTKDVK